jgi:Zn-dependent protease
MTTSSFGTVPYIPDFSHLAVDTFVSFVVSALVAIMINAEAQAWMATLLGDTRPDAKDRFHFIAFLHMSVWGSLCYLVGGFGWPKPIALDVTKFRHPQLYTVLVRFAGAFANFLLANIAASMTIVFKFVDLDPLVFLMLAGVNLTTAVYHLIPIPPLAAGSLITAGLPEQSPFLNRVTYFSGSGLILAIFLAERLTGVGILSPFLNPLLQTLMRFLVK